MRRAILVAAALGCCAVGATVTLVRAKAPEAAQTICVKYCPCPLDVSSFTCTDTPRSSFVRVCYDEPKSFMAIKLKESWYSYCEIDAATVSKLLSAPSICRFYNQAIRSRPEGTHGPFDCRDHPMPNYVREKAG
jgi:KTSC domain